MRRLGVCLSSLVLVIAAGCAQPAPPPAAPAAPAMTPVQRGEYIVNTGLCNDCHTPMKMGPNGPEPDMDRLLSGHPENIKVTPGKIPDGFLAMGSMTFTAWQG